MRRFVQLFLELNASNRTQYKLDALTRYFHEAEAKDSIWALYFLTGKKLRTVATPKQLRSWVADVTQLPLWIVDRSYEVAGDLAETLASLLPREKDAVTIEHRSSLSHVVEEILIPLRERSDSSKFESLRHQWSIMTFEECFIFNKLITGGFRLGASKTLVERALAKACELPHATMTHRLAGDWQPTIETWERITDPAEDVRDQAAPYVFFLAHPLEERSQAAESRSENESLRRLQNLGEIEDWQIEWKWDGIRAQILRRGDVAMLWSRGEERVHEMFPEIAEVAQSLPSGTVLDGEIVHWDDGSVGSFAQLQHRIGRKKVSQKILRQYPCVFVSYDILEFEGKDIRESPLSERRKILDGLIRSWMEAGGGVTENKLRPEREVTQADFFDELGEASVDDAVPRLQISDVLSPASWRDAIRLRETARERRVEGFMLKRKSSAYQSGRPKGDWWKWKLDPFSVDCVMLYAQAGHGRRAGLYTDFTFGVLDDGKYLPFAKAYSGLSDAEFKQVDSWIKKNTVSKKGPVRMVHPELVFEVAFENIHHSDRHRSGIAVRFPRILRWRHDKRPEEIDTIDSLKALIC